MDIAPAEVIDLFRSCGAFLEGHFVGSSGLHLDTYLAKDMVFARPRDLDKLAVRLAEKAGMIEGGNPHGIQVVAGAEKGGIVLASRVAAYLGPDVLAVYAEKTTDGTLEFRRGYDRLLEDRRVLAVEDVVTTGASLRGLLDAVAECRGILVAAGCLVVRFDPAFARRSLSPLPFRHLAEISLRSWPAEDCPMCRDGIPVRVDFGHGAAFLNHGRGPHG